MAELGEPALTEYGRLQGYAEDASALVVDQILTDGGTVLWQKYLERKAFPFAADATVDASVSRLQMCFVTHDDGEKPDDLEQWTLEEEPEPGEIDSWARMHLSVRRQATKQDGKKKKQAGDAAMIAEVARGSDTQGRGIVGTPGASGTPAAAEPKKKAGKGRAAESRVQPLSEEAYLDEEEEKLRDSKYSEEAKRREKEKQARDAERRKEMEQKRIADLHEEMAKRPHTFDHDGNLIWIDEVRVDKLPSVQEKFPYTIKKNVGRGDARQQSDMEFTDKSLGSTKDLAGKKGDKSRRNRQRDARGGLGAEPEFTDSFSKLQHGQPPILETMTVMPGVMLEASGRKKTGPEPRNDGKMTRKDYVQMAERDISIGPTSDVDSPNAKAAGDDKKRGAGAPGGEGGDQGGDDAAPGGEAAAVGVLPSIPPGRTSVVNQKGSAVDFGGDSPPPKPREIKKAPPAPAYHTRAKKFDAVGWNFQKSRYHKPALGGQQPGFGMAQPPLGATMGHGLMRHGSMKDSYFFPPKVPPLNAGVLRSASEGALGSSRKGGLSPGGNAPSSRGDVSRLDASLMGGASSEEMLELKHGTLVAEKTNAYRVFKMALNPDKRI